MKLRPYQRKAIEAAEESFKKHKAALMVMATGLGKTIIACQLIKNEPKRTMFVAHRTELIEQAAEKIHKITCIPPDIEKSGSWASRMHKNDCVIGSVQTLTNGRYLDFDPMEFGLFINDEAHHCIAPSFQRVIQHFKKNPDCKIFGMTATTKRSDEAALGQVFDTCAIEYPVLDAINDGWLVPVKQRCGFMKDLDLSNVGTSGDDLNVNELSRELETRKVLGPMAYEAMEKCGDKRALFFVPSVPNAEKVVAILNDAKPGCANYVCHKTPDECRSEIVSAHKAGEFQFFVNVGITTEGYDDPDIEVIIMGRPTKSILLYEQMMGRGTRLSSEISHEINDLETEWDRKALIARSPKPFVEVLDFVGNSGRHKLITSTDVLGGIYPDYVIDFAKEELERAEKERKPLDTITVLQRAERDIARRRRKAIEAQLHKEIIITATFDWQDVDPFDAMDIVPHYLNHWEKKHKPTHKMIQFLHRRNIRNAEEMSFIHAGQLIEAFKKREDGRMTIGKFKGRPIDRVPQYYLDWCLKQKWLNPNLRTQIQKHYTERNWTTS